jgi:hypothetical protein
MVASLTVNEEAQIRRMLALDQHGRPEQALVAARRVRSVNWRPTGNHGTLAAVRSRMSSTKKSQSTLAFLT